MEIIRIPVGDFQANCYILFLPQRDDCVLIDPGWEENIIKTHIGPRKVAGVLLTHGHFDHMGAAAAFTNKVYLHEEELIMLTDSHYNVSDQFGYALDFTGLTPVAVHEGEEILLGGMVFKVLHTPGHTRGSVCFECGEHLFTGDTLFKSGYGTYTLPGGNLQELRHSLKRLISIRDNYTIHPGHNGETTILSERGAYE